MWSNGAMEEGIIRQQTVAKTPNNLNAGAIWCPRVVRGDIFASTTSSFNFLLEFAHGMSHEFVELLREVDNSVPTTNVFNICLGCV
ncbi:hypothetical protein AB1N83_009627 [Pleurotus pulmonarius]